MIKVAIAQLGARKHYQEPILLHQWGILEALYTDFCAGNSLPIRLLRHPQLGPHLPRAVKSMVERYDPALQGAQIIHFPRLAFQYVKARQRATSQELSQIFINTNKVFCQNIIQQGLNNANTVYGFNSASLELFHYAKSKDVRCILDQTLAERSYLHQILLEEEEKWPNWSMTPFKVTEADQEFFQREQQEQDIADQIICGSNFVKESLVAQGISGDKVTVIPLGKTKTSDLQKKVTEKPKSWLNRTEGIHILFAGDVGIRKGIPYLLQALRKLKGEIPFVCKIAGSLSIKPDRVNEYSDVCQFLGRVPRSDMDKLYRWADVFFFPSLYEGSAMVTYEAAQYGLPVITTHNSGSALEGLQGHYIVPIRDASAIAKSLISLFHSGYDKNLGARSQDYLDKINEHAINKFRQTIFLTS